MGNVHQIPSNAATIFSNTKGAHSPSETPKRSFSYVLGGNPSKRDIKSGEEKRREKGERNRKKKEKEGKEKKKTKGKKEKRGKEKIKKKKGGGKEGKKGAPTS